MSGDYTRFTHDPLKRRSGVLMQQGRVQLDSDWNEFVGIAKRRQRLQSLDTFGPYGVPYKTTPDAFLIGLIGGPIPDLSIEPGRLYVEGRLAELFDTENATYLDQPFYPDPPPLPGGDSVVYLDVWEREVTYIEDASLLDVALGGADTATRTQTVWQVRADARDAAVCDMDVGEEPSAGRLSTDAILPPAPDDPCILPPIAGYRGLENRLYRVEIHDAGGMGVARFKWSRDNGSIVSAVRGLAVAGGQTTLTVNRIGRDPVLRFRIDDWVTVTDDHRELMGEPGEMARVFDIVETRNEIILDRALPTPGERAFGANPGELVARHTRIQRWDQTAATNVVDADGLILTAAGPIDLEDGIQISFDLLPAAGGFRAFDYWVFAARVADASVEILDRAPPRGIHHHYVQLAAITGLGGAAPAVTDCRPPPPDDEECCCSVTVAVGEGIQDAIDSLPPEGGCVCLKTGIHTPRDTIVIARPNVKLTGESPGVFVDVMNGDPVLFIGRASGIRVDTIIFRAAIESGAGVVMVAGADDVAFFDCGMENRAARRVIGIDVERTDRLRIEASTIRSVEVGIRFVGYCELPVVAGNRIAPGGQGEGTLPIAILAEGAGSPITVTGNTILDAAFGIVINDAFPFGEPTSFAQGSIVLDNLLIMPPFPRGDADRLIAIDVAADLCRISGNRIALNSVDHLAIRATGSDTIVNENIILSQVRGGDELRLPVGIQIGFEGEAGGAPTTEVVVADNRLEGRLHGIMAISARNVAIHDNAIVGERGGLSFGILLNRTQNAAVTGNRIGGAFAGLGSLSGRANRFAGNDVSSAAAGVFLVQEAEPAVSTNRIHDTTLFGAFGMFLIGRCDFVENRLTACANQARLAIGLGALLVIGELHVEANEVTNTGMTPDNKLQAGRAIGIYGAFVLEARIESNLVTHTDALQRDPQREDRALLLGGLFELSVAFAADSFVLGFPVQITANKFIGTGRMALVELVQFRITDNIALRFERVFFNENYCSHVSVESNDDGRATVVLVGRAAVVMSNQIKATTRNFPSVNFNGMRGPFIGNITHGGAINHVAFPAPENAFNQIM